MSIEPILPSPHEEEMLQMVREVEAQVEQWVREMMLPAELLGVGGRGDTVRRWDADGQQDAPAPKSVTWPEPPGLER